MKKKGLFLILFFVILFSVSAYSYADNVQKNTADMIDITYDTSYLRHNLVQRLHKKAKGRASDVIAIAKSQRGYKGLVSTEGKKRYSYFVNEWKPARKKNEDMSGNWCSEFAWWCLVKAKVLKGREGLVDVESFRHYFRKRMYKLKDSAECSKKYHSIPQSKIVSNWFKNYKGKGIFEVKDLKKGDILQICSDKKKRKKEPHHTAIFCGRSGNKIYVWEGNMGNDGTYSYVRKGKYKAHEIIAVLRPKYSTKKGKK